MADERLSIKMKREELKLKLAEIREAESVLDREEFIAKLPRINKSVGKTFAYRHTSYSCPEKASDYWDVFRKILRIVPFEDQTGCWIVYQECQLDSHGSASIRTGSDWLEDEKSYFGPDWCECPDAEYAENYAIVKESLKYPKELVRRLGA